MRVKGSQSESRRIIVAGVGLVTPLGFSSWETFRALVDGRTIADRCAELPDDVAAVDLVRAVGSVAAVQHAADDPCVELAERVAREALYEAGNVGQEIPCFLGTSKGAIHALIKAAKYPQRFPDAVALGPFGYLADRLKKRLISSVRLNPVTHHVAACASGLTALHYARTQLLKPDAPDHALVISADSAMSPMLIHSYQRLGVLAECTSRGYRGKPLDAGRRGFMLGEMAAAVVLRRVDDDSPGGIELLDTACACEAFDLIRPSPRADALRHVAMHLYRDRRIDVLHPHAPGTVDHDVVEMQAHGRALHAMRHRAQPMAYACKGSIGHGLGAAGLVSFVIACLMARSQRRPPMPWLNVPIDSPLPIVREAQSLASSSTHAIFAAGFGGHVAGTVIQKN